MNPNQQRSFQNQAALLSGMNAVNLNQSQNRSAMSYVPMTPPRGQANPSSPQMMGMYSPSQWQHAHNSMYTDHRVAHGKDASQYWAPTMSPSLHTLTPPRNNGSSALFHHRNDQRVSPQHPQHHRQQQYYNSPDQALRNSPATTCSGLTSPSTELTSTAAPFIPGRSNTGASTSSKDAGNEKLVQVTRGGCIFFVPESQVLLEEQHANSTAHRGDPELIEPSGREWEVSTIPTPPRRTLQFLLSHGNLREIFDSQNEIMRRQVPPNDERYKEIPTQFSCMYPLDDETSRRGAFGSFGYPTFVYKVVSQTDGMTYALRRVDNVRTTHEIASAAVDTWRRVRHANIVTLHRAFVSNGALFFLNDFYPGAESIRQRYLDKRGPLIPESLIWTYLTQLVSALRAIHASGLACRVIDPIRILLSGQNRVRINGVGVIDILEYDTKKSIADLQREDLISLGKLVLSVVCRCTVTPATVNKSLDFIAQHYSRELSALTASLVSKPTTIYDVCGMTAGHIMEELDRQYTTMDALEVELSKEYQNGRLFLLMLKLGLINERPEYNMDSSWAETGDRYLVKLFRDYVFHQVGENSQPVIDYGHIIESLNKLDLGDQEKILLTSPDQQSILVASFADIKKCIDKSFNELVQKKPSSTGGANQMPGGGRGNRSGLASRGRFGGRQSHR